MPTNYIFKSVPPFFAGISRLLLGGVLGVTMLSGQVHLSIEHTSLHSDSTYAIVPVQLSNPWDEVAGVQIELRMPHADVTLDTVLAVGRAAGWLVQYETPTAQQPVRLLVFDPAGNNLEVGDGPILKLIYSVPHQGSFPVPIPVVLMGATLSDVAGFGLPVELTGGTITIQPNITISVGSAVVDQGHAVRIRVKLEAAAHTLLRTVDLAIDTSLLSLTGVIDSAATGCTWVLERNGSTLQLLPQHAPDSTACLAIVELIVAVRAGIAATSTSINVGLPVASPGRLRVSDGTITIYPGYLPPPKNIAVAQTTTGLSLTWEPPINVSEQGPQLTGFGILRAIISDPSSVDTLITVLGIQAGYTDQAVLPGQQYRYELTTLYDDNYESIPQNIVATWQRPALIRIGNLAVAPGELVSLPLYLDNYDPVGGIRGLLLVEPPGNFIPTKVLTSGRIPADWIWRLTPDSASGGIALVAFSPALSTIPAGSGEVLRLDMAPLSNMPADSITVRLNGLVVAAPNGETILALSEQGTIAIVREPALLGVETGFAVAPGKSTDFTVYLNNPQPLSAFQLVISMADPLVALSAVIPGERLPEDFRLTVDRLPDGSQRVIGSALSNAAISPGQGGILQVTALTDERIGQGAVAIVIDQVLLSDVHGNDWPHREEPGLLAVGDISLTVTPESVEGRRGKTVTVPINITTAGPVARLALVLAYDTKMLRYLRHTALPAANALALTDIATPVGTVRFNFAGNDSTFLPGGAHRLLDVVFQISANVTVDAALKIRVIDVVAQTIGGTQIFSKGQTGEIKIGVPPPVPEHFTVQAAATGPAHFIRLRHVTLGGTYLRPGDEIALWDSNGVVDEVGNRGPLIVGAGVIRLDGSTDITARLGLLVEKANVPGALPGNRILYQTWDRSRNLESLLTDDAKYIMGRGRWGENNGFSIVELVRTPRETAATMVRPPGQLVIRQISPNPMIDSTSITIGLPVETDLQVVVFDQLGRKITTLHDGITKAGWHVITWQIDSIERARIRSGMLFCRVKAGARTITRKMIIMH